MKERFSRLEKEEFTKAQALSKKGDLTGELEIMENLVKLNPESAIFRAVLGNIFWCLGELNTAEKEFRRAVKLAPESEKTSLGLFHCLWEQNKKDAAFEEMKRFTKISNSEDYSAIVKEINQKL